MNYTKRINIRIPAPWLEQIRDHAETVIERPPTKPGKPGHFAEWIRIAIKKQAAAEGLILSKGGPNET